MCEAVGEAYLPLYFETIAKALRRGGRAVIRRSPSPTTVSPLIAHNADFIQRFVFPGGFLPSEALLREHCVAAPA